MNSVIITAGGTSSRFKGENKLLYKIGEKTVIECCIDKFINLDFIDEIIISANISVIDIFTEMFSFSNKIKVIEGGSSRQESVLKGLLACSCPDYVLIHDAARPFIEEKTIITCIENAKKVGASIVAVKAIDTVKIVDNNGIISSTPDRNTLWNAQTPQIFKYETILELHKKFAGKNFTDDSLLFEEAGLPVCITEGEYSNFKITTIQDVEKIKNKNEG
jgi:2-C-methyl-D-erythritol 4-phosphate cytidylyltransferase